MISSVTFFFKISQLPFLEPVIRKCPHITATWWHTHTYRNLIQTLVYPPFLSETFQPETFYTNVFHQTHCPHHTFIAYISSLSHRGAFKQLPNSYNSCYHKQRCYDQACIPLPYTHTPSFSHYKYPCPNLLVHSTSTSRSKTQSKQQCENMDSAEETLAEHSLNCTEDFCLYSTVTRAEVTLKEHRQRVNDFCVNATTSTVTSKENPSSPSCCTAHILYAF